MLSAIILLLCDLTSIAFVFGDHLQFQLHYTMMENEPIGYRVGYLDDNLMQQQVVNFSRLCNHHGPHGCKELKFRLREPSNLFELDESSAMLTTKAIIDFEQICSGGNVEAANLNLMVNLWQEKNLAAVIHVTIRIQDVDDNHVEFPADISRPFIFRMKEVIYTKGKTIELPRAIDRDVTPKFSVISYRLNFSQQQWDSMRVVELQVTNDSRPLLVLKKDLDYEEGQEYQFNLIAQNPNTQSGHNLEGNSDAVLPILIKVLNINDMEPVFSSSLYNVDVSEDTVIGTVIIELKAIDKDADAVLTYSVNLEPGANLSQPFQVETDGRVRLKEALNFEKHPEYFLPIRASDGEFVASTRLRVTVVDVNDEPPKFIVNPTVITIEENQPANVLVGQVVVTDADSFAVNGQVECSEPIEDTEKQPLRFSRRISRSDSPTSNRFTVPEISFDLYTKQTLDREDGPPVRLNRLICWDAVDIVNGNYDNEHSLSQDHYQTIKRLTSTLTVSVHVLDKNDNPPVFTKSVFNAELEENNDKKTKILQLTSKDYDTDENSITRYQMVDQNEDYSHFYLDEESGWLYAMSQFDRETRDVYHLQVIAFDASENPLNIAGNPAGSPLPTSTAMVTIRILDKNDHAPIFQEADDLSLVENMESGTLVGHVYATDLDIGLNGKIVYKMFPVSSSVVFHNLKDTIGFEMTPNGTIFATRTFDRETQSRHCFQVQAVDQAEENPLSSSTRMCVNIVDANDNPPTIHSIEGPDAHYERDSLSEKPQYSGMDEYNSPIPSGISGTYSLTSSDLPSLKLSTNEAPGYLVLYFQATDVDEGDNAKLKFSVNTKANCTTLQPERRFLEKETGGSGEVDRFIFFKDPGTFRMDERTGKLLLLRRLRREESGVYCLGLVVVDMGEPKLLSEQLIKLIVEDVSSRGNWLNSKKDNPNQQVRGSSRLEAKNILIVIVLSTVSAFLAAVLISAILCMVRPFHKTRQTRGGKQAFHGGVNPTVMIHTVGRGGITGGGTLSGRSLGADESSARMAMLSGSLDGCSGVGEGTWIVGPGNLINSYDAYGAEAPTEGQDSADTYRMQTGGINQVWNPMQGNSSEATGSICAFEANNTLLCDQRPQHYILHQSPLNYIPTFSAATLPSSMLTQEMVGMQGGQVDLMSTGGGGGGGQDEQRSDSGRGASDEEIIFQAPTLHSLLCGIQATRGSNAMTLTDAFGRKCSGPSNEMIEHADDGQSGLMGTINRINSDGKIISATSQSGIYVCPSSLANQNNVLNPTDPQRSVSTFVHSKSPSITSSLPRELYSNGMIVDSNLNSPRTNRRSEKRLEEKQSLVNKNFSLPREGLAMTKSILVDQSEARANRLCEEIDHLLFENII